jgi:hypothetical protein
MVSFTLPPALEMPARAPDDMVDVEAGILDFGDVQDPPALRYEWPAAPY